MYQHIGEQTCLHYMAFGRVWQHAEYSYGVWESFAHQASTIQRTHFCGPHIEKYKHIFHLFGFGTQIVEKMCFACQNAG
jgi:hypothetical protein